MKDKYRKANLIAVVFGTSTLLLIGALLISNNYKKIKQLEAELDKPSVIREYLDRNNNGFYDSYRLIKKYSEGQEKVIPDEFGREIRLFRFYNQFGGEVKEATRANLNYAFNEWNYPEGVDRIKFENLIY